MSLISKWFSTTLAYLTDDQNTPEVDLQDSFEAIEIDIPEIETAEVQIKGANTSGGTFDLIAQEEPVPSSLGGFRTTVPLGGKYQFIKVYLSAAQTADRVFAVRGVSYASAGLVALIDRIKNITVDVGDIEDGIDELKVLVGALDDAVVNAGAVGSTTAKLRRLTTDLDALITVIGAVTASPTQYTTNERLKVLNVSIQSLLTTLGLVAASPTENTVQERLLVLETALGSVVTALAPLASTLSVTRVAGGLSTTELGSAGNFLAAAGKLYWLLFTNEAGSASFCTLNDATSGTGSKKATLYQASESSFTHIFDPPIEFATGIRMGAASAQVKVTGGYIAD